MGGIFDFRVAKDAQSHHHTLDVILQPRNPAVCNIQTFIPLSVTRTSLNGERGRCLQANLNSESLLTGAVEFQSF